MPLAPTITLRDIPKSEALHAHILDKIDKLSQFCQQIMHCDVIVEPIQKHKHQGKLYNCRITLTVPNIECVVSNPVDEDVYIAVCDAFSAMRRKLQDFSRKRRGEVKMHDLPYHGHVARLYHDQGFGFIESNGSEYYFTKQNVADFDKLELGTFVQFIENLGDEGLQANRVTLGKHHGIESIAK